MISREEAKPAGKPKSIFMRVGAFAAALLLFPVISPAQDQHVAWTLRAEPATTAPGGKVLLHMTGKIEEGWHLYSMSTPAAIPTKIQLTGPAVEKFRALQSPPKRSFDPNFNSDTEYYEGQVEFLLDVDL